MRGISELGGEIRLPGTWFSFMVKIVLTVLLSVPWAIVLVRSWIPDPVASQWPTLALIAGVVALSLFLASRVEQYYCHALFSTGFRKLVFRIILSNQDEIKFWNEAFRRELGIDITKLVDAEAELKED